MLNSENRAKCRYVLNKYGYRHQTVKLIEECAELQEAACDAMLHGVHLFRPISQHFREEVVDVIVMTYQACLMAGIGEEEINRRAAQKLDYALAGKSCNDCAYADQVKSIDGETVAQRCAWDGSASYIANPEKAAKACKYYRPEDPEEMELYRPDDPKETEAENVQKP